MNKQIKKTPLSHFHLIKKATMDDLNIIKSEGVWLQNCIMYAMSRIN